MANEYTLSYTAQEIDNKLKKVDKLVSTVNGVSPDANGNVRLEIGGASGSSPAIIDVMSLPTENINSGAFYRLLKADFVYYNEIIHDTNFTIYCVDSLPETGEVVTDAEMSFMKFYYSVQSNDVYGYVDSLLAAGFGFPSSGWIDYGTLCAFIDETYGGVITDIDQATDYNTYYVLLTKKLYTYDNGWKELPYAYESDPEFDITWDGVIGDKFSLDMSALGYAYTYMVKVSDEVFTVDQLLGATATQKNGFNTVLTEYDLDTSTYSGAISVGGGMIVIIHSQEETNSALGLPSGYLTNGTYFVYVEAINDEETGLFTTANWTNRIVGKSYVTKIDSKFIDTVNITENVFSTIKTTLSEVALTGEYSSLKNRPTIYTDTLRYSNYQSLTSSQKSIARSNIGVYSMTEVDNKIANVASEGKIQSMIDTSIETAISNAIGNAIGGSY